MLHNLEKSSCESDLRLYLLAKIASDGNFRLLFWKKMY